MTHDEKMQLLPEPPTESSNDELNTELAELSLRANAALVGLGAVSDGRPLPDRVRDAVGEFGIALGTQESVVNGGGEASGAARFSPPSCSSVAERTPNQEDDERI